MLPVAKSAAILARAQTIGELVKRKNLQYGDSFSKSQQIIQILYPNGVHPKQYADFLALIRVIDKLFRVANGNQGDENAWDDITGYGIIAGIKGETTNE